MINKRYFVTYLIPTDSPGWSGTRTIIECPSESTMLEMYEICGGSDSGVELFTAEFDWQPYEYQGEENGSND